MKEKLFGCINAMTEELVGMSDYIFDNPELALNLIIKYINYILLY